MVNYLMVNLQVGHSLSCSFFAHYAFEQCSIMQPIAHNYHMAQTFYMEFNFMVSSITVKLKFIKPQPVMYILCYATVFLFDPL